MFANLKNKIKEEIGSDVATVIRNAGSVRGLNRHPSRAGSASSISSSQISLDETIREENNVSPTLSYRLQRENSFELKLGDGTPLSAKDIKRLESREDEWRKRLQKKETEFLKKMEKKEEEHRIRMLEREKEWKKIIDQNEKEKAKLVEDRQKAESARNVLEVALSDAEEYKKKLSTFQEDLEQMEGLQHQELAKIKHLLLVKEHEVEDKSQLLKTTLSEVDNLKMELSRLRRYEDEMNNVQDEMESLRHSTQREKAQLSSKLAQTEEEARHLKDKLFLLEQRFSLGSVTSELTLDDRVADLMRERALLERKLEEAHLHLSDIKTSWSAKISSLETQVGRLSRQAGEEGLERRRVEEEKETLKLRIKELESEIEVKNVVMATKDAKLLRMTEDIDEMATELKELRANVDDEVDEFKRQIEQAMQEINEHKTLLEEANNNLAIKDAKVNEIESVYEEEKSKNLMLQLEVERLKEQSTQEINELKALLEEAKNNFAIKEAEVYEIQSIDKEKKEKHLMLELEVERLKEELESEKTMKTNINLNLEKEKSEKDSALLRTAKISQEIQIAKQETKAQELENSELQSQLDCLSEDLNSKSKDLVEITEKFNEALTKIQDFEKIKLDTERSEGNENALRTSLLDMEEQLSEKNKTIKVLQQRLADMKKTLHRELRVPSASLDNDVEPTTTTTTTAADPAAILDPSSSKTVTAKHNNSSREDDVNFEYLKHVLIKFLTSREYEALHLTRAVATLLHFSPEEEKLLQETLEWKMSWFGTKPNLGIGQTAKAILPS